MARTAKQAAASRKNLVKARAAKKKAPKYRGDFARNMLNSMWEQQFNPPDVARRVPTRTKPMGGGEIAMRMINNGLRANYSLPMFSKKQIKATRKKSAGRKIRTVRYNKEAWR
jgi:hypothetical protein